MLNGNTLHGFYLLSEKGQCPTEKKHRRGLVSVKGEDSFAMSYNRNIKVSWFFTTFTF